MKERYVFIFKLVVCENNKTSTNQFLNRDTYKCYSGRLTSMDSLLLIYIRSRSILVRCPLCPLESSFLKPC